jgi:hypothetical protein
MANTSHNYRDSYTKFEWYNNGKKFSRILLTNSVLDYQNAVEKITPLCDDINNVTSTSV